MNFKPFYSCDWGTTHFRLRAMAPGGGTIAAETTSEQGVAALAERPAGLRSDSFRAVLAHALRLLDERTGPEFHRAPVAISGMASSSIGWKELPYARLPLPLDGGGLVWGELEPIDGHRIVLISGAASAHDVMRGEETQALGVFRLAGLKSLSAGCLLVLPGTHCKHLRIADGKIQEFHTFMTGELFAVISQHSILRHSVGPVPQATQTLEGRRLAAYRSGVAAARDLPLAAALFRVRTRQLLDGQAAEFNRAYLSGLLVGSELAYVTDQVPGGWPLVLSAAPALSSVYCEALSALGLEDRLHVVSPEDGARLSAQGQSVLLRRLDWI